MRAQSLRGLSPPALAAASGPTSTFHWPGLIPEGPLLFNGSSLGLGLLGLDWGSGDLEPASVA